MTLAQTESFYTVVNDEITAGPHGRPKRFGPRDPDSVLAAQGEWRLWEETPAQPGKFYRLQRGAPTTNPGASPPRVERIDTWIEYTPAEKREAHLAVIEQQRLAVDRSAIDLRWDPGLHGLMDEANIGASERRNALGTTDDADLDVFDPTLDPRVANSVQLAASLASQERALLNSPVPYTAAQRTTLQAVADGHQAVVDAGDTQAAVDEVPSFARRQVGVQGEEFGRCVATRPFQNPWYWLEIDLWVERDIDGATYFLAIYDESVPDDRDDTVSGYMSTAQLVEVEPGHLRASKEAINLARGLDQGYKFTLCKGHISQPQFDRVHLPGGEVYGEYRFRWNGLV